MTQLTVNHNGMLCLCVVHLGIPPCLRYCSGHTSQGEPHPLPSPLPHNGLSYLQAHFSTVGFEVLFPHLSSPILRFHSSALVALLLLKCMPALRQNVTPLGYSCQL